MFSIFVNVVAVRGCEAASGGSVHAGGMGCIAAAAEAEAADGEDAAAGVGVAGRKEARKCAADTCARITATSEAGSASNFSIVWLFMSSSSSTIPVGLAARRH